MEDSSSPMPAKPDSATATQRKFARLADATASFLIEQAVIDGSGRLSADGALSVTTGKHTGRAAHDKYLVVYPEFENPLWLNELNQPMQPEIFDHLLERARGYLQGQRVFSQDLEVRTGPASRLPIRLITTSSWHALFSQNLFLPKSDHAEPRLTILHCPEFSITPLMEGIRSETIIALDLRRGIILICGTAYAGEIKKAVFSALNYWLPQTGVLSMHCAANAGANGDVALFFGLSGTGKTTLSTDPQRPLIGDDEHGWSTGGVFNLEGGCYAKTIHLRPELEPLIWDACHRFRTILENVPLGSLSRVPDFDDAGLTENTRAAYPLDFIPGRFLGESARAPKNIFFLSADAFGVLPPLSKLSEEQALYYFLSGYTSKLGGTEEGLSPEPEATFSTCFAAPFLPLKPHFYSDLFASLLRDQKPSVWLVNTGWLGGPPDRVPRISLPVTRNLIHAALSGELERISMHEIGELGLSVPTECPGVPSDLLDPVVYWQDKYAYTQASTQLVRVFRSNFEQLGVDPRLSIF